MFPLWPELVHPCKRMRTNGDLFSKIALPLVLWYFASSTLGLLNMLLGFKLEAASLCTTSPREPRILLLAVSEILPQSGFSRISISTKLLPCLQRKIPTFIPRKHPEVDFSKWENPSSPKKSENDSSNTATHYIGVVACAPVPVHVWNVCNVCGVCRPFLP